MSEQNSVSDGLDRSVDGGVDKAMAAKGVYDTAQGIGAAAAEAGAAAAGPAGTVAGTIIGLAAGVLAKPVIKGLIVIVAALIMIFSSLPSMLFENARDVADNAGPVEVYAQFKDYTMGKYGDELDKRKEEIESDFRRRVRHGEFDRYDHVDFSYSFNPAEAVFLEELGDASTLIIAMFEVSTDNWRKATFSDFKRKANSVYFWNDTITVSKAGEEREVTRNDGESTLHIHITYDI